MKKLFLGALAFCFAGSLSADNAPLWMRDCKISPNGEQIAFTYKGDIYTVPTKGGRATQITSNPSYDTAPIWSPDSKKIAFASDRMGSIDIFVVSSEGGAPQRVTTHSNSEIPLAFKDNDHLLYKASLMPAAEDVVFPSGQFPQVYEVSIRGGRPHMFSSIPMERISINENGAFLYQDMKGYEDHWRKHHVSPIARDIWMYDANQSPAYQKQTTFGGEDREPVWSANGKDFYYLSEEKGSFNVYLRSLGADKAKQITHHTKHPVRFLSIAKNNTLCYFYDGEIYTLTPNKKPQKVNISIVTDRNDKDLIKMIRNNGATEIAVSPKGKEIAFVMHGDVYVTSLEYKTTKQVTDTPQQERNIDFAPDGRTLVYASERNGVWQLYTSSIVNEDEKQFTYATELKEEPLTTSNVASFQPKFSPNGKEVAFLENRTTIRVVNVKSKKVRTVMDGRFEYSYADGDQWFEWSPDSKWLLAGYIGFGGWHNRDVVLLNADGKSPLTNLTESGYNDSNAKWVLGGKAMIWFSDRAGYRSHGSWGTENDVYIMFFDADAYSRFRMNKEDLALLDEAERLEKEKKMKEEKEQAEKDKKKKGNKKGKDEKKAAKPEEKSLEFDLENRFDRVLRLTVNSSRMSDAVLAPKGDKLYYTAKFEGGFDLWEHNLKEGSTRLLIKGIGGSALVPDKDGRNIFMCDGNIKKIDMASNRVSPISFEAFFNYRPYEERTYMFDHIYRQMKDKLYIADLGGVDWDGYAKAYRRFLPHIDNNHDFAELLSEFLGEINASHTGASYSAGGNALPTAALGVFYDESHTGKGLKIKEIIAQSPLAQKKTQVEEGCIIEQVDGVTIEPNMDYFPLFEGKVGRKIKLTVYNPLTKKRFEETVKGISYGAQNGLLYKRWVKRCAKTVDELSNGRVAYIHLKGMDSPSFRNMYSELLGRYRNKEAVIVDTRHNGGGWLHDDVVTLLSGKEYLRFAPRGQYIGSDPYMKWTKPSCMMTCEDNYSNAHGTPFVYKALGIGKLIGAPVAGTMTAVWWERQIDPSIVFGIPQVGCTDVNGKYLENNTLEPDILIYNEPEANLRGEDLQLKAAVEHMLQEADKAKMK